MIIHYVLDTLGFSEQCTYPCPKADRLSWVSIAGKRFHDHGNSYKEKHLIGAGLQLRGLVSLSSQHEAWQHSGRQDGEEVAENSTSRSAGSNEF